MSRFVNDNVLLEISRVGRIDVPDDCDRVFVCDQGGVLLEKILRTGRWKAKRVNWALAGQDLWELAPRAHDDDGQRL
jgi:hypothetical protein